MREECRGLGQRGATAVFVAVALAALLGMAALAVDVGMLMKVRTDAQRAADAAALAGAKEFLDNPDPAAAKNDAALQALHYASRNYVGWQYVDTSGAIFMDSGNNRIANSPEAYVQVLTDEQKVRVFIRRATTANWFGKMFGRDFVPITVKAAAQAVNAGTGKCVKPFAVADIWSDADNDNDIPNRLEDLGKGSGKNGERWMFNTGVGDRYRGWQDNRPGVTGEETGYGSGYRNGSVAKGDQTNTRYFDDWGRPITLKKSDPNQTPSPSFFEPWVLPGSGPGAKDYRHNIATCNPVEVSLGAEYSTDPSADTSSYDNKPGNMIGPTKQGMDSLISLDPDACWFQFTDSVHSGGGTTYTTGEVRKLDNSKNCTVAYPGWESSPRVIIAPLFDPAQVQSGKTKLKFNNLALFFIEDQKNRSEPVVARFLYFAKSTGPLGPATGSLIKKLQLVE